MTYDRGQLEIMSPLPLHEKIVRLLGDLISIWRIELRIPIASCGELTISRAALKRGFEPDHCYYVQHEPQMWDKTKINFKVDPPPDLAIEVGVTRKLGKKVEIYAAFGVPELWRWSENSLRSSSFPWKATTFLAQRAFVSRPSRSPRCRKPCGKLARFTKPTSSSLFTTGCGRTYNRPLELRKPASNLAAF